MLNEVDSFEWWEIKQEEIDDLLGPFSKTRFLDWKDRCELCGARENLEAHHKHYFTFGFERREDIMILCHECHMELHRKHEENN